MKCDATAYGYSKADLLGCAKHGHLPFTGFDLIAVVFVAILLIAVGIALFRASRPNEPYSPSSLRS